jgi:hypothetical protein
MDMLDHLVAYYEVECIVFEGEILHVRVRILYFNYVSIFSVNEGVEALNATYSQNFPAHGFA